MGIALGTSNRNIIDDLPNSFKNEFINFVKDAVKRNYRISEDHPHFQNLYNDRLGTAFREFLSQKTGIDLTTSYMQAARTGDVSTARNAMQAALANLRNQEFIQEQKAEAERRKVGEISAAEKAKKDKELVDAALAKAISERTQQAASALLNTPTATPTPYPTADDNEESLIAENVSPDEVKQYANEAQQRLEENAPRIVNNQQTTPRKSPLLEEMQRLQDIDLTNNNDATNNLANKFLKAYSDIDAQVNDALDNGQITQAEQLTRIRNLWQPRVSQVQNFKDLYNAAVASGKTEDLNKYNAYITNNVVDAFLGKSVERRQIEADPLKDADGKPIEGSMFGSNSNLPVTISSVDAATQKGDPKWLQELAMNLLHQFSKQMNERPYFPLAKPVAGQSSTRVIANKQAIKNLEENNLSEDYKPIRQDLRDLSRMSLDNYKKLQQEATASPFDQFPGKAAKPKTLREAAISALSAAQENGFKDKEPADILADVYMDWTNPQNQDLPELDESETTYIDRYMNPYRKKVVADALEELDKEFEEKTLPMINHELTMRGGMASGYRNSLLMKAKKDLSDVKRKTRNELNYKGYRDALNDVMQNRQLALQGADMFASRGESALNKRAALPKEQAFAQAMASNTLNQIANYEEGLQQKILDSAYDLERDIFFAPARTTASNLDALRANKPAIEQFQAKSAPQEPRSTPTDMMMQMAFMGGMHNMMQNRAAGGRILNNEDAMYEKLQMLADRYRSQPKPDTMRQIMLDAIANMYAGKSKYIADNVTSNMPNTLNKLSAAEDAYNNRELQAIDAELKLRKLMKEDEADALHRENAEFDKFYKMQDLEMRRAKLYGDGTPQTEPLSHEEKKTIETITKDTMKEAKAADETIPLFNMLDEAFKEYDKHAVFYSEPGDLITSETAREYGSEYLMPTKQRAAAQKIEKVKGELATALFSGGLGHDLGVKSEDEMRKALPDINLLPEARQAILKNIVSKASLRKLRNKFYYNYKQMNNGRIAGADLAFDDFVSQANPLNEYGYVKPEINDLLAMYFNPESEQQDSESLIGDSLNQGDILQAIEAELKRRGK